VLTPRRGKPRELCLIGIQLEPIGRHPICNSCQTSSNLLQQGTDIRWTTCTINLSVVSVEVRDRFVAVLQMLVALKGTGCDVWQLEYQASNVTASV